MRWNKFLGDAIVRHANDVSCGCTDEVRVWDRWTIKVAHAIHRQCGFWNQRFQRYR